MSRNNEQIRSSRSQNRPSFFEPIPSNVFRSVFAINLEKIEQDKENKKPTSENIDNSIPRQSLATRDSRII